MYEIKKLNVISCALAGMWILGLMAIMYMLMAALLFGVFTHGYYGGNVSYSLGFISGLVFVGGITGFIGGAIFALLYNLWASWVGGIKMDICQIVELQETKKNKKT